MPYAHTFHGNCIKRNQNGNERTVKSPIRLCLFTSCFANVSFVNFHLCLCFILFRLIFCYFSHDSATTQLNLILQNTDMVLSVSDQKCVHCTYKRSRVLVFRPTCQCEAKTVRNNFETCNYVTKSQLCKLKLLMKNLILHKLVK